MDRYYTILIETLKQLGRDDRATRDAVYRRARDELDRMLDGQDQPIPITQRIAQKSELEQAIARLEGEFAARAARIGDPGDRRPATEPVVAERPGPAFDAADRQQAAPPAPQDPTIPEFPLSETPAPEPPEPPMAAANERRFELESEDVSDAAAAPRLPQHSPPEPPAFADLDTDWGRMAAPSQWPDAVDPSEPLGDLARAAETVGSERRRPALRIPDLGGLLRRDRQEARPPDALGDQAGELRGAIDAPEILDSGQRTPLPAPQGRDVSEILSARGRSRRRLLIAGAAGAVVVVGAAAYWSWAGSGEDPMQALAETVMPLFTGDDPSVLTAVGGETVAALDGQPVARLMSAARANGADMRAVGALVDIPGDLRGQVHNRFLRITAIARRAADNGSEAFAIAYTTVSAGASDWNEFDLDDDFRAFEFVYLRSGNPGDPAPDAIVIRADPSGRGGGIDLRFVGIEILA